VSRILVADDNSNIQKMVALALKDEGIDVVAVGNGDAAMRKIPDLHPDLILADIFMPVRSGYEVCEFVKNDSRYMHTPVVLLVGAFDPLDEQETQRVRADGVLKKPFVPPDPLINMVKALLAKSFAERPLPVAAAVPAQPVVQAQLVPSGVWQPGVQTVLDEPPAERPPERPSKIRVTAEERPVEFDTARENSASDLASLDDPDAVITAPRDPSLGEPVFSVPDEESEEPEADEEEAETKPKDMVDAHSWGKGDFSHGRNTARFQAQVPPFESDDSVAHLVETPPAEANDSQPVNAVEGDANAGVAHYESQEPSSAAPTEMPPFEALQFDPALTFPASAPSEWPPLSEQSVTTMDSEPTTAASEPLEQAPAESAETVYMDLRPLESPVSELESPVSEDHATVSLPAGRDSELDAHGAAEMPLRTPEQLEPVEMDALPLPTHDAMITAATEAARLALSELNPLPDSSASAETAKFPASIWANPGQAAADTRSASAEELHDSTAAAGISPNGAQSPASPEMIEAVVNRLLERMQPQVMDVVNREVLRPAIEAMVRREMEKG
jgi:CheY-like chemotaxis protein